MHFLISHQHFGGSTGYGHDEAGGRGALDQAFAEIVGAESAIVRSQVLSFPCVLFYTILHNAYRMSLGTMVRLLPYMIRRSWVQILETTSLLVGIKAIYIYYP